MPYSKTKELARKLGVIGKKRKLESNDGAGGKRKQRKGQFLSHLMVIDFESTCWENKRGQQEIIEFPAVLLDLSSGEIVGEFQQYVLPMEHPTLSDFCKQLTGITQEQVDNGVPIQTCLYLFKQWVSELQQQRGVVMMEPGQEYSHDQQLCSFCTWSDWDLGVCLYYECRRKQIRVPAYFKQWVNIRALYKTFYERRPSGLRGSLEDLGMRFEGQEHSGIDDARNTAKLCYRMVKDGCKLNITKSIDHKAISIIKQPNASILLQKAALKPTAPTEFISASTKVQPDHTPPEDPHSDRSPTDASFSPLINKQSAAQDKQVTCCTTTTVENATSETDKELVNAWDGSFDDDIFLAEAFVEVTKDSVLKDLSLSNKHSAKELTPNTALPHMNTRQLFTQLPCQKHTPNRVVSHVLSPLSSNCILGSLPTPSTSQCVSNSKAQLHPCVRTHGGSSSFKTMSALVNSISTSSSSPHYQTPHSSTYHTPHTSTYHTPHTSTLSTHHKMTPPMCDCGRRTKRKLVTKNGPNEGKPFYVCPVSSGSNKAKGCGFFKWEETQKENWCSSVCSPTVCAESGM